MHFNYLQFCLLGISSVLTYGMYIKIFIMSSLHCLSRRTFVWIFTEVHLCFPQNQCTSENGAFCGKRLFLLLCFFIQYLSKIAYKFTLSVYLCISFNSLWHTFNLSQFLNELILFLEIPELAKGMFSFWSTLWVNPTEYFF